MHISEGYGDTIFKMFDNISLKKSLQICFYVERALNTHLYQQVKICPILPPLPSPASKTKGKEKKKQKNKTRESQKIN